MLKRKWIIVAFMVLSFFLLGASAYGESEKSVKITIINGESKIFEKDYFINPDFLAQKVDKRDFAISLSSNFGDLDTCDYIFDGLGNETKELLDNIDDVKESDCIVFNKNSLTFSYHADKSGYKVDRNAFYHKIYDNLDKNNITINLTYLKGENRYTLTKLKEYTQLVGEYETNYSNSIQSRKNNIRLASKKISGKVIKVGQTFSFNQTVGKRTLENGFQEGVVIESGEYVKGVGGGVCQVATTVYNALLRAGCSAVSCHRHTLAPSYVPLSFDAMVSEYADLKMKNDTSADIYIGITCDDKTIKVKVYGKKDNGITYDFRSELIETLCHQDYDQDPTICRNGYKSKGYKLIYKNGVLVKKILLRTDFYKPYKVKI